MDNYFGNPAIKLTYPALFAESECGRLSGFSILDRQGDIYAAPLLKMVDTDSARSVYAQSIPTHYQQHQEGYFYFPSVYIERNNGCQSSYLCTCSLSHQNQTSDGTKNMKQTEVAIIPLIILLILVIASLWGLLDVALSRYEDKATRLLGVLIISPTIEGSFVLSVWLTPKLLLVSGIHAFDFIPFSIFDTHPVMYLSLPLLYCGSCDFYYAATPTVK